MLKCDCPTKCQQRDWIVQNMIYTIANTVNTLNNFRNYGGLVVENTSWKTSCTLDATFSIICISQLPVAVDFPPKIRESQIIQEWTCDNSRVDNNLFSSKVGSLSAESLLTAGSLAPIGTLIAERIVSLSSTRGFKESFEDAEP